MRPLNAQINLAAIRSNLELLRRRASKSEVIAVVKANAYGHGVVEVVKSLEGAKKLAVATIEEAVFLRNVACHKPICLLQGPYDGNDIELAVRHGFELFVHSAYQIDLLRQRTTKELPRIWLKVDSGMNRLGFTLSDLRHLREIFDYELQLKTPLGLASHFAYADEPGSPDLQAQWGRLRQLSSWPGPKSFSNSAAVWSVPDAHQDFIRPGLALYGSSPLKDKRPDELGLKPAMVLRSELIATRTVKEGDKVGYGGTWSAGGTQNIGLVACGYGDGFPRFCHRGSVWLFHPSGGGTRVQLAGRVSMDSFAIDLKGCDWARPGTPVEIWGPNNPVEQVAQSADTISYEVLCRLAPRVRKIYNN